MTPRQFISLSLFLANLLWCLPHADGAFERPPLVPQISARGGTSVGWSNGNAAFLWNPAAKVSSRLLTAYSQPFGVEDLAEGILSYSHAVTDSGSLGLSWQRFRTTGYHEDRRSLAASYGNRMGGAGVRLDLFGIGIDGFGSRTALGVSVGGLWKVSPNLQAGVAFDSLNRPEIPNPLPRGIAFGVGAQARPDLLLLADFRWATGRDLQILAGSELSIGQHFVLRGGMHNQPWEVTAGWGLQIRSVEVDYAWVNHFNLDGTHQISISWQFKG